jgi:hypothetical protein
MPTDDQEPKLDTRWDNIPAIFVVREVGLLLVCGLVIPLAFLPITVLGFETIPSIVSVELIDWLRPIWPFLSENYERMRTIGRVSDANNFVLFFLVVSAFGFLLVILTVVKYVKAATPLNFPDVPDVVIILLFAVNYFFFFRSERFEVEFTGIYDFYLDRIGIFYIRQYIFVACIYCATLVLLLSIFKLFQWFIRRN